MGIAGARAGFAAPKAHAATLVALLQAAGSLLLLGLASDPALRIWQPPASARELLALSPPARSAARC